MQEAPGRPYPTTTQLGKYMELRGLKCYDVSYLARVPPRTLTEYLAGRKRMLPHHRARLCDLLECDPEDLD